MCMSGAETRRALGEDDWPLLVINTPLSDESGIDLAIDAASHTATSVLMLVKAELADQVQAQLENYGVFVVAKPVARPLFDQAIRYAAVLRNRLMTVCAEKAKLEKKLADVRVIDRAKCLLIQYRGMTEEQAHRAIEKAGNGHAADARRRRPDGHQSLRRIITCGRQKCVCRFFDGKSLAFLPQVMLNCKVGKFAKALFCFNRPQSPARTRSFHFLYRRNLSLWRSRLLPSLAAPTLANPLFQPNRRKAYLHRGVYPRRDP